MKYSEELKEIIKQALLSTYNVISDNFKRNTKKNDKDNQSFNFKNLENFLNKRDIEKLRANIDSEALKFKYSNNDILNLNKPDNNLANDLYMVAEKLRYQLIGLKKYKGIKKNIINNYSTESLINENNNNKQINKNLLKAFELYLIKNFLNIKMSKMSQEILEEWEHRFNEIFFQNLNFLKENVNNQEIYNSKISTLIKELDFIDNTDSTQN